MNIACRPAMTPAHRKYVVRTFILMALYVAINVAAIFGLFDSVENTPLAWGLALAVSIPVAGHMWTILMLIRDSDEFVRGVTARQFIVASGLAMALFSAWGFAESYADAPHAPGWMVYPLFWGLFGVVSPFIKTTRG